MLLRLRQDLFLEVELGHGRVLGGAVPLVEAAPVGAAQRLRHDRPLRRGQRDHLLPRRAGDDPLGQVLEQRRRGLVVPADGVVGQELAQAADQVRFAPGWLGFLQCGQRQGHHLALLLRCQLKDRAGLRFWLGAGTAPAADPWQHRLQRAGFAGAGLRRPAAHLSR